MSDGSKKTLLHIGLFIATFVTTTLAGAEWSHGKSIFYGEFGWNDFVGGMSFSIPFLLVLTVHEFGHYFAARYHNVNSSLPYYIPLPPFPLSIGTLGAVIRLRQRVPTIKQNFDIGIAGPLAGFVMAILILIYGFTNLPPAEYIFQIHPEYEEYGLDYAQHVYNEDGPQNIVLGTNLIFVFFERYVADPTRLPNHHEMMHYPFLFAGFLSLFFTALNLLPVGQLDGGHVLYGLFGQKRHQIIASVVFVLFMGYAGLGLQYIEPSNSVNDLLVAIPLYVFFLFLVLRGLQFPPRDTIMVSLAIFAVQFLLMRLFPGIEGFPGWLLFGFIVGRFVGIAHPKAEIEEPLDSSRQFLGWLALVVFVICLSPSPLR